MLIETHPAVENPPVEAASWRGRTPGKPVHLQAAGLSDSALAGRFCFWRGRSGRRYVFSVYPLTAEADVDALPRYPDAVVIIARRGSAGDRTIVALGDSGPLPDVAPVMAAALRKRQAGDELHVHLLANDGRGRRAVLDDLAPVMRRA